MTTTNTAFRHRSLSGATVAAVAAVLAGCGATRTVTVRAPSTAAAHARAAGPASISEQTFTDPRFAITFQIPTQLQRFNLPNYSSGIRGRPYAATVSLLAVGTGEIIVDRFNDAADSPVLPSDLARSKREFLAAERRHGNTDTGIATLVQSGLPIITYQTRTYPDGRTFGPGAVVWDGTTLYDILVDAEPNAKAHATMTSTFRTILDALHVRT
jgi:hypothetical protein